MCLHVTSEKLKKKIGSSHYSDSWKKRTRPDEIQARFCEMRQTKTATEASSQHCKIF